MHTALWRRPRGSTPVAPTGPPERPAARRRATFAGAGQASQDGEGNASGAPGGEAGGHQGRQAARGTGRARKHKLIAQQVTHARDLSKASPSNVARLLGIGRSTLYRPLRNGHERSEFVFICVDHERVRALPLP